MLGRLKSETNRPARVLQTVIVVRRGPIDEAGADGVKHGAAPARVNKVRVPQADPPSGIRPGPWTEPRRALESARQVR